MDKSRQAHDELESLRSRARRRLEADDEKPMLPLGLFSISLAAWLVVKWDKWAISKFHEIKTSRGRLVGC